MLLELLVAYQTIWDFLDNASERGAHAGETNAQQLHLALTDALDPEAGVSDYYRHHPWRDDGGYLQALVGVCQVSSKTLPSCAVVRSLTLRGAAQCAVQSANHNPDPQRRAAGLADWAAREFPGEQRLSWFEVTAAASAFIPHVLLAVAVDPACDEVDVARAHLAYFPWVSLAIAMLDSYVDLAEDHARGSHSYISHYGDRELAVERLCEIIDRAFREVRALRDGRRHAVIVACMVAMYLSKDACRVTHTRAGRRRLVRAGGSLTRVMLSVLRVRHWAGPQRRAPAGVLRW